MDIYIFWVFSSSRNEGKKNMCEKKTVWDMIWATAQTVSRYNGNCIVT